MSILFLCIFIIGLAVWLFASRRRSIPCPTWLSWLVEKDNPFSKIHRAATIIENSDIREGMSVLDAGCGPGRVTIPVAKAVGPTGKVVAMDIQAGMLSKVQQKAEMKKLTNIKFLHAGVGDKRLEHSQFDRALMVTVLGEIPDPKTALEEIFYSLKPGGILSVTEIIFDPHFLRRSRVARLAHAAGFQEKMQFGNCIAFTMLLEKPSINRNAIPHGPFF